MSSFMQRRSNHEGVYIRTLFPSALLIILSGNKCQRGPFISTWYNSFACLYGGKYFETISICLHQCIKEHCPAWLDMVVTHKITSPIISQIFSTNLATDTDVAFKNIQNIPSISRNTDSFLSISNDSSLFVLTKPKT